MADGVGQDKHWQMEWKKVKGMEDEADVENGLADGEKGAKCIGEWRGSR